MPARSVCLVALSLSEAGPGRFGRQVSIIDIYHTTIPYHSHTSSTTWASSSTTMSATTNATAITSATTTTTMLLTVR